MLPLARDQADEDVYVAVDDDLVNASRPKQGNRNHGVAAHNAAQGECQ